MITDHLSRVRAGTIIVRAPHRLVVGNRRDMLEHLRMLLADEWGTVVLDCSNMVEIDSSALGVLCSVCMVTRGTAQAFVLADLKEFFRTHLAETRLDVLFQIADEIPPGEIDTWICPEISADAFAVDAAGDE